MRAGIITICLVFCSNLWAITIEKNIELVEYHPAPFAETSFDYDTYQFSSKNQNDHSVINAYLHGSDELDRVDIKNSFEKIVEELNQELKDKHPELRLKAVLKFKEDLTRNKRFISFSIYKLNNQSVNQEFIFSNDFDFKCAADKMLASIL